MLNSIVGLLNGGAGGGGGAYESIATASGTGSSATITFSSIPSTYQHLQVRVIGKASGTVDSFRAARVTANSDSGANYAFHSLNGNGTTASAYASSSDVYMNLGNVFQDSGSTFTNQVGAMIIDIIDYASTTKNKTFRAFGGGDANGSGNLQLNSGFWMSTSAITSLTITCSSGNWTTSSIFSLYGIK